MDFVPREGHRTPALRPGVARLIMAKSGRHAPLRFRRVWVSALSGISHLVQCSATTAGGRDWKADEIFMPASKAQVHVAVTAYAEQLVTARAAPVR